MNLRKFTDFSEGCSDTGNISYFVKGSLQSSALSRKQRQLSMFCVCEGTINQRNLTDFHVALESWNCRVLLHWIISAAYGSELKALMQINMERTESRIKPINWILQNSINQLNPSDWAVNQANIKQTWINATHGLFLNWMIQPFKHCSYNHVATTS